MIDNFVRISLKDLLEQTTIQKIQTKRSITIFYPCSSNHQCTPYVIDISPGVYRFECWGSKGGDWGSVNHTIPGLGGYTSGTIFIQNPTKFFVYIGTIGFFNAVKGFDSSIGVVSGGATDVRLNASNDWWDENSLISRIMVAAGGGGAEWYGSVGGNGGGLVGGKSISASRNI